MTTGDAPTAPDPGQRGRLIARALLLIVLIVVAIIVFTPGPPADHSQRSLIQWFDHAHRHGLPSWISFALAEALSNVVMFLPLGLLGALSLRRHAWVVLPLGVLTAATIELVQLLALPNRTASLQDIAVNVAGAAAGLLLAIPALNRRRRRERRAALGRRGAGDRPPIVSTGTGVPV